MFRIITRNEAIKKLEEYFNNESYSNVGILFEKTKDGIKLLDDVKKNISKKDSIVWNKTQLENKEKTKFLVENCRTHNKLFCVTISKFFVEYKAFVKHLDSIGDCVLCPQSCINPESVENFIICDSEKEVNCLKEKDLKIISFD